MKVIEVSDSVNGEKQTGTLAKFLRINSEGELSNSN